MPLLHYQDVLLQLVPLCCCQQWQFGTDMMGQIHPLSQHPDRRVSPLPEKPIMSAGSELRVAHKLMRDLDKLHKVREAQRSRDERISFQNTPRLPEIHRSGFQNTDHFTNKNNLKANVSLQRADISFFLVKFFTSRMRVQ